MFGIAAFIGLHAWGQWPSPQIDVAGHTTDLLALLRAHAVRYGQYAIPVICLVVAVIAFARQRKRKASTDDAAVGPEFVKQLTWREFELLIGEGFRQRGYAVTGVGGDGVEGDADLVLKKANQKYLVHCRHWRANKVNAQSVRDLHEVVSGNGAAGAFIMTAGRFTGDARAFAKTHDITLVAGADLVRLLQRARYSHAMTTVLPMDTGAQKIASSRPPCPLCGSPMVLRRARRGANAGKRFWGCSEFPSCRGVGRTA